MVNPPLRVGVLGADGFTGRLIVEALGAQPAHIIKLTRRASKTAATDVEHRTVAEPTDLPFAVRDLDVLVDATGDYGASLFQRSDAAADHGVPVVALCGEHDALEQVFALRADRDRVTLVPAAGFSPVLVELATWLATKRLAAVHAVRAYRANRGPVGTAGSLRTYLRAARRAREVPFTGSPTVVSFAAGWGERACAPIAGPADITLRSAFAGLREVRSAIAVGPPRMAALKTLTAYTQDVGLLERLLAQREADGPPTEAERAEMAFALRVEVSGADNTRVVEMWGSDPYGITAQLAAAIALRVGADKRRGVCAAVEVADPQALLAKIAQSGVRFRSIDVLAT